ncbi:hypothetical protein CDAR_171881, partial [Caerostris darwini]
MGGGCKTGMKKSSAPELWINLVLVSSRLLR